MASRFRGERPDSDVATEDDEIPGYPVNTGIGCVTEQTEPRPAQWIDWSPFEGARRARRECLGAEDEGRAYLDTLGQLEMIQLKSDEAGTRYFRLMSTRNPQMRNSHGRLERLERPAAAHLACHCCTVVRDDEEAPASCPHGRPWFVVLRIVHEERSAHA